MKNKMDIFKKHQSAVCVKLLDIAQYYGQELTMYQASVFTQEMSRFPLALIDLAIEKYKSNPKNRQHPFPAELRFLIFGFDEVDKWASDGYPFDWPKRTESPQDQSQDGS